MILRLFTSIFILVYGTALPIYFSFKAIEAHSITDMERWTTYWMTFALFSRIVSTIERCRFIWIPFFHHIVLLIFIYLASPYFEGSNRIYKLYFRPLFKQYENTIDEQLDAFWKSTSEFVVRLFAAAVRFIITESKKKIISDDNETDFDLLEFSDETNNETTDADLSNEPEDCVGLRSETPWYLSSKKEKVCKKKSDQKRKAAQ